jgi:spore coat protein U-like protein
VPAYRCIVGIYGGHRTGRKPGAGLAVVLAAILATPAQAAGTASTANAVTLRPLSIVNITELDFGTNAAGAVAGTVVIDPTNDARSTTGGVTPAGGTPNAGKFYTYGGPLQYVQVNRGALPVLNRAGGGATMNVTQLTLNGPTLRYLDTAGLLDLRVGGTLAIGANQLAGSYSGTFQIIVTYF